LLNTPGVLTNKNGDPGFIEVTIKIDAEMNVLNQGIGTFISTDMDEQLSYSMETCKNLLLLRTVISYMSGFGKEFNLCLLWPKI